MQTASLQNGFFQARADTKSFGGGAAGSAGSFKSTFDSMTKERGGLHSDTNVEMRQQDERTIHRTREREEAKNKEIDGAGEADATQPAARTQRADGEKQEDQSDASTAKAKDKEPVETKAKKSDDGEEQTDAAAIAAAASVQVPTENVEQPADPQAVAIGSEDAKATNIDPLQAALQAGTAADETAGEAAGEEASAVKPVAGKPVEKSKLSEIAEQMDAVPESSESDAKAVEATKSSDGEEGSSDLLNQAATKLPDDAKPAEAKTAPSTFDRDLTTLQNSLQSTAKPDATQAVKVQPLPTLTPEQQFVQDNVDQVVTSVRTQSIAGGGSMHVRLDPPELGALQVAVKMVEGRLTASFTTSNEQATQLLSHSLQHLKSSLEASGVNVDRIEVRQAPQSESSNSKSNSDSQQQQQRGFDSQSQQSEQNRKDMVRKMWRKLAFGTDDLDLVA